MTPQPIFDCDVKRFAAAQSWVAGHQVIALNIPLAYQLRRIYCTFRVLGTTFDAYVRLYHKGQRVYDWPVSRSIAQTWIRPFPAARDTYVALGMNSIAVAIPANPANTSLLPSTTHICAPREWVGPADRAALEIMQSDFTGLDCFLGVESQVWMAQTR